MQLERFALFLDELEVDADIGIHDFEKQRRQRLLITIHVEIAPGQLPSEDAISETFDYDWLRDQVKALVASRHFELQETLASAIVQLIFERPEVQRASVETAKPDVYPDAGAVGCRLEARR